MKLNKLKKNNVNFEFFEADKLSNDFFRKIYSCTVSDANKYILEHCLKLNFIAECFQMNEDLFKYGKKKLQENLLLWNYQYDHIEQLVESNKEFSANKFMPIDRDKAKKYYAGYSNLYKQFSKRKDFLKDCEKFIYENKKFYQNGGMVVGGAICGLWVAVALAYRYAIYSRNVKDKYNEIYDFESLRLKDDYAQSLGFESSDTMESYFNNFLIQISKQDAIDNLTQTHLTNQNTLANYLGFDNAEQMQQLIDDGVKTLSKSQYVDLLKDKLNINMKMIANDNGFASVEEMEEYLDNNVIYHPARRVYTYPTWRKVPEYYEYTTAKAEQVFYEKKELQSNYNYEMNHLPLRKGETIDTIANPTLSVANDKLNALENDYLCELEKIQNDSDFPKFDYSNDVVKSAVDSYDAFNDTISSKVTDLAKADVDFECNPVLDFAVPAVSFSCLVFALKMAKNVKVNKKIKELNKAFDYINENQTNKDEKVINDKESQKEM